MGCAVRSGTKKYLLEYMLMDAGIVGYRCTDVNSQVNVLRGAAPSSIHAERLCKEQLEYIRIACEGAWDIELTVRRTEGGWG